MSYTKKSSPSCFNSVPADQEPKIMLFGDPHGDFAPVLRAFGEHGPEAIVLLGDLTPKKPLHEELDQILDLTEVWFIPGNHDSDESESWDNLTTRVEGTPLQGRNLHGRVARICGLQVAGLGGIFRESVWYPRDDANAESAFASPQALLKQMKLPERWRGGVSLRHRTSIFPSDVEALAHRRVDLLVTHEAPSWHRHGFAAIEHLAERMQARWLVHGHHHTDIDYQAGPERIRKPTGCGVMAYGVDKGSFLALPR